MKNKLNLPPFYIGQKVIYITGRNMPKNSIHTISDMQQNVCGCWTIEINGNLVKRGPIKPEANIVVCEDCNYMKSRTSTDYKLKGWCPNSFRAIQEQSFPLIKLSQIKETEKEEILIEN